MADETQADPSKTVLIFVDADNTLWDTNAVYATAQLKLLDSMESRLGLQTPASDRLAYVRAIDQALALKHHRGLRYPIRLLIRALELSLAGAPGDRAARLAWTRASSPSQLPRSVITELESAFNERLSVVPGIRSGVREGLADLSGHGYRIIVLTEGNITRVKAVAEELDLTSFFDGILEAKKEVQTLRRLHKAYGLSSLVFMVGDQIDRDIRPARQAGFKTILFPGAFQPIREFHGGADVAPDFVVDTFSTVPKLVAQTTSAMRENLIRDHTSF